ncbi:MAG: MBL fold metallo-hydrolase [Rhodobacterales bacterium]|nr:MBL fold metallo-hydrolase [Rhodobacterales bacterium]
MKHTFFALAFLASPAVAEPVLTVQNVAPDTYAIVGPLSQRDPENLGNNATFGLIVTDAGAVLIDAGGSRKGAQALHDTIRTITDRPVTHVINSGGQDHRWLGNAYWREQGATIIASQDAVTDQQDRVSVQLTVLTALIGQDALTGTEPAYADTTFNETFTLNVGQKTLNLVHIDGGAHTPGDAFIWDQSTDTVFSGDIVYINRILGVGSQSNTLTWVETFDAIAGLNPKNLVPGHGPATDMLTAKHDTYDYLQNLRFRMADYIDGGGDMIGSVNIDQSDFAYLENFEGLAKRNAQETFSQMEWE